MFLDDVYGKPGHLIRRAQQIAVAIFVEECRHLDLTPVQYAVLVATRDAPGIDATRLSEVIAYDRSTLGSVLDRVEEKGWVERRPSPGDRRVKQLFLTEAGAGLLAAAEPHVRRAQERIVQPLAEPQRQELMRLLGALVELNNEHSRVPLKRAL
ncbi:transcriptional regulator, MarR family [Tistlia consotensis]|uniref:Transcriptional regulator, MarR family n=1 Tax=Tistlia consotensis USBA 355 TaxID=560819 RepID=A0A1Y6CAQ4_9PROT|nr:MarR family transcriptional regulator [Tistlia consotensis]SMF51911.1 transcriptional regulator, MarR family [Tistlia consotensis USBA 355]SNR83594.1 transcriptional regulator, MarR family [Tistlia consotensis]